MVSSVCCSTRVVVGIIVVPPLALGKMRISALPCYSWFFMLKNSVMWCRLSVINGTGRILLPLRPCHHRRALGAAFHRVLDDRLSFELLHPPRWRGGIMQMLHPMTG